MPEIEQMEHGREEITPDYHGAFAATLLSLYKDPKVSKKRKRHIQSEMRQSAIAVYESSEEAADTETLWCPVAKDLSPKRTIVAANLVPYSLSNGVAEYLFGNGPEARMNTPDNCLMIC